MAPRKLLDEPDMRIVEDIVGEQVVHVLEVRDGVDAMGAERWRTFQLGSKDLRQLFGYLVRVTLELEAVHKLK